MSEKFPTLSLKERDRRWNCIMDLMKSNGVECLVVPGFKGREELEGYLSNEYAQGLVVFPLDGNPVHLTWTGTRITRHMESTLRGVTPWVEDMRVGVNGPALVDVLKEKGFEKGRIGVVGLESRAPGEPEGFFPYKTWAYVLKELPQATFIELSDAFAEMILVKSEEEIALMRHSAMIGEEACKKMLEIVEPGVNERDIYLAIIAVIFKYGASSPEPFLILHSGLENLSWGPPMWKYQGGTARTIKQGDLVQAEIFPRYGGMESQQQMSVHFKPLNKTIVELAMVARRSYEIGLAALHAGTTFQDVCDAMEGPVLEERCWHLTPLIHSLSPSGWVSGTGVGIERDSGMGWLEGKVRSRGVTGGDLLIKPGMVFELEPNACKAKHRVNIGGTVVVTEDGVEELNKLPTEMQVIG